MQQTKSIGSVGMVIIFRFILKLMKLFILRSKEDS
jgi:hypothetical protein